MGRGLNMEHFPSGLNILSILNISPVLSTFWGTCCKRLNRLGIFPVEALLKFHPLFSGVLAPVSPQNIEHIEHFHCFGHFSKFHPLYSSVMAPVSTQKIEHLEHFPCFRHFLKFHPLFSSVLAPVSPKTIEHIDEHFPYFMHLGGLGLCFKGFGASITKSYLKV